MGQEIGMMMMMMGYGNGSLLNVICFLSRGRNIRWMGLAVGVMCSPQLAGFVAPFFWGVSIGRKLGRLSSAFQMDFHILFTVGTSRRR